MLVNLFPLASLLDQYPCALISDLSGSAIRTSGCSHQVACDDCGRANFFIVYNETRFTDGVFSGESDRSLIFKITYSLHR